MKCPKCGGRILLDHSGEGSCINCGYTDHRSERLTPVKNNVYTFRAGLAKDLRISTRELDREVRDEKRDKL